MSNDSDRSGSELPRRTFLKTSGVALGAAALGASGAGTAAAQGIDELDDRLLNWRTVEARKV